MSIVHENDFPDIYIIRKENYYVVHWDALGADMELPMDFVSLREDLLKTIPELKLNNLGSDSSRIGKVRTTSQIKAQTVQMLIRRHLFGGRSWGNPKGIEDRRKHGSPLPDGHTPAVLARINQFLRILAASPDRAMTARQLVDALPDKVTVKSISNYLSTMQAEGLIVRNRSGYDPSKRPIQLTAKGYFKVYPKQGD